MMVNDTIDRLATELRVLCCSQTFWSSGITASLVIKRATASCEYV
jgi:hypothetical protein